MKTYVPDYYKDFECIADKCMDTCCAGWDVDVDREAYEVYKNVSGSFGDRLKKVMVPDEEGCTFALKGNRCPFLNDKNFCDLYTAMGEDNLCETCADFPRFINDFGDRREVGLAPSCITAGELMLSYTGRKTYVQDNKALKNSAGKDTRDNDDEGDFEELTYRELFGAREVAFAIIEDRSMSINSRLLEFMDLCDHIQYCLDMEEDEKINGVRYQKESVNYNKNSVKYIGEFFEEFPGMEVINEDWLVYVQKVKKHLQKSEDEIIEDYRRFDAYYADRQTEYEQLLWYYIYRYFLSAVYDYNINLKCKNAVVGFLCLKEMGVALFAEKASVTFAEQVDMAHLYSRQFEHSYFNYEKYQEFFERKQCYSMKSLREVLKLTV